MVGVLDSGGTPSELNTVSDTTWSRADETRFAQQMAAIEVSNDGIAIADADGLFTYMNLAHATMFGYPDQGTLLGQPWSVLYGDVELQRLQEQVMPVLASKGRWRGHAVGRSKDGDPVQQEISLSLSADGGIVCVTRDIGNRIAEEREKALLREQLMLAQRQDAVGQLAIELAHDFNNLIATIAGTAGLLQSIGDGVVFKHAARIETAAEAAAGLVSKLMALGSRQRARRLIDLRNVLKNVKELIGPTLSEERHALGLGLQAEPLLAQADMSELLQVVMNLALNARDSLPENGVGHICLSLRRSKAATPVGPVVVGRLPAKECAVIEVEDSGCGIPPELFSRLFEPFFTTKGERGTGLGLPVVARIVADADGAIAVSSTVGKGTIFQVWWPLQSETNDVPAVAVAHDQTVNLEGKRVLVIDDNLPVAQTIAAILEQAGAHVGVFRDAPDALNKFNADPNGWDLVVTDYAMPAMSGAELAERIKSQRQDLPIILVTALPQMVKRYPEDAQNFQLVLGKPVSRSTLLDAAHSALAAAG